MSACARLAAIAAFGFALGGCASTVGVAGNVTADARAFALEPRFPGQARGDGVSLVAEPEVSAKSENGVHAAKLRPFYRMDPIDERRTHADVREASYKLWLDPVEASLGVGTFSWGVLDSYRPTDIINQIDFVESPNGSAKLGQPFLQLGYIGEKVAFRAYGLPFFRDRTFPGVRGRLRFPVVIDTAHAEIDSKLGRFQPSGAARLSFDLGDADIGIGAFTGLAREPRFIAELTTGQVIPRYDVIHQGSVDAQWAVGAFVLKAEGYARLWRDTDFYFGGGGGLDIMLAKWLGGVDLTLALEALYDSRPRDAPPTFFQHDAFAGFRLGFEDEASTEITGGALVDMLDGATFGRLDASRRFGEHWRLGADANVFFAPSGTLEGSFRRDHFGRVRLAYHF